jgi:hypothetical protein
VINVKREQIVQVIPTGCPLSVSTVERTSFFDIEETGEERIY